MTTYGPVPNDTYSYNKALNQFINQSTKYVSHLSDFNKYIIWRYTIGSASVNYFLIFNKIGPNATRWTYLFFKYFKNTFPNGTNIPSDFRQWDLYFDNPNLFNPTPNKSNIIAGVISAFINRLQRLILDAPKTPGSFRVFKVATKYPALPDNKNEIPSDVVQLPFNSTTISPHFNFAPFIDPNSGCCIFDIEIPKGSHCLFIPQQYHAYPFELEVILPTNCLFHIYNIRTSVLDYINPKTVNMIVLQNERNIKIGPVFEINEYNPCKVKCFIQQKQFKVYDAKYRNP